MFDFLDDKRIKVNRILLPQYLEYSKRYGFKCEINPRKIAKCPIHKDLLSGLKYENSEELFVSHFSMKLQRDD
jgi:hypothetical protein